MRLFLRKEDGSAVSEMALLLPILLFVFLAPMIYSLAVWGKIVVTDSAREASRYEALNLGNAEEKVRQVLEDGNLNEDNLQNVSVDEGSNYVTVSVTYEQPTYLPLVPVLLGGDPLTDHIILDSSAVFKKEKT